MSLLPSLFSFSPSSIYAFLSASLSAHSMSYSLSSLFSLHLHTTYLLCANFCVSALTSSYVIPLYTLEPYLIVPLLLYLNYLPTSLSSALALSLSGFVTSIYIHSHVFPVYIHSSFSLLSLSHSLCSTHSVFNTLPFLFSLFYLRIPHFLLGVWHWNQLFNSVISPEFLLMRYSTKKRI